MTILPAPAEPMPSGTELLEELQIKIAYLERANSELSDVVYRQHRDIEIMQGQLAALARRLEAARSDEEPPPPAPQEKPPHY